MMSYQEPEPVCEVCRKFPDAGCECPECPTCGEAGSYACYAEHDLENPRGEPIRNIKELCESQGAHSKEHDDKACAARIARSLFGCSFYWQPPLNTSYGYVSVAGYCEGSDGHIEPHVLNFPFFLADYEEAVAEADADGVAEWNNTHGCEDCCKDELDGCEPEDLHDPRPVDPDCKSCGGAGIII